MQRAPACKANARGGKFALKGPQRAHLRPAALRHPQSARAALVESPTSTSGDTGMNGNGHLVSMDQMGGTQVSVSGLRREYKTEKGIFVAIDDVSLDITPNQITALLGPSGSGKTTFMRLISGLDTVTSGNITFDGVDVTDLPVQERECGFVFQNYALWNHKTVLENIMFGVEIKHKRGLLKELDARKRAEELLKLVQLDGLGDRYPRQLSGGQRQRVALARSLAYKPRLLFLDEPFGALDAVVRKDLRAWMKELMSTIDITCILVTHDQEEARDLAEEIIVFNKGRVEQIGTAEEIAESPQTPFVKNFTSMSSVLASNNMLVRNSSFRTSKPSVLVDPKDVEVYSERPTDGPARRAVTCTVKHRVNLGWEVIYEVMLKEGDLLEKRYPRAEDPDFDVGETLYAYAPPLAFMSFVSEDLTTISKPQALPAASAANLTFDE
ncbi:sulfate/thiosulfate transport system ATP-binding protein [Pycnococcus provasolii]